MTRLAHISDLHWGATPVPQLAEAVRERVLAWTPQLVIVTGDLSHRAQSEQFRGVRTFLDSLGVPWLAVPGNHDLPLWRRGRALAAYRAIIGEPESAWRGDGLLVIGLNSVHLRHWQAGGLSSAQIARLQALGRAAPPDTAIVVAAHHPFLASPDRPRKGRIAGARGFLRLFDDLGVTLVLGGHVHQPYVAAWRELCHGQRGGPGLIVCQAGGSLTRPRPNRASERNAWQRITLTSDTVTITTDLWQESRGSFVELAERQFQRRAGQALPPGPAPVATGAEDSLTTSPPARG